MAGKEGSIGRGALETWKTWNKITLVGALTVAVLVPSLTGPALAMAAFDGVQIVAVNEINKKKKSSGTIFQRRS